MRVDQIGIVFFNGGYRTGVIDSIGENNVVLEFYPDGGGQGQYKASHPKDSVLLINTSNRMEKDTVCSVRVADSLLSPSTYRRLTGSIVEDVYINEVTGEEECVILTTRAIEGEEVGYEFCRKTILPEMLEPVGSETAMGIAHRFTDGDIHFPQDIKSKILHRDCEQCGKSINVIDYTNQFLSGGDIPEEHCICFTCKVKEENHFNCKLCDVTFTLQDVHTRFHSYRTCEISRFYGKICISCSRNITLCDNCSIVTDGDSISVNNRKLCTICSERTLRETFSHPSRTIFPSANSPEGCFSKNKSKRHVGIEIECIHDWRSLDIPRGWRIVSDTSISDEEYGAEYVMSEPLNGDRLLSKIENITYLIEGTGGYVDESCGLHVHINGLDMGLTEMKNCLAIGKSMETWIYDMLPPDRRLSRYSKPLPDFDVKELMSIPTYRDFVKFWYHQLSNTDITTEKYNDSRYRGFNVHSRIINGTIEFRHHQGTLHYDSIVKWMKLCIAVVDTSFNMSKTSKEILIDKPLEYSASDFFYAVGLPEFYNHYNSMKENVKKSKPKSRIEPFSITSEMIDEIVTDNLGMIQERDSETLRM